MARCTDSIRMYQSDQSRADYTSKEMARVATMFKALARDEAKTVLRKMGDRSSQHRIRILSLGCGPGSDLLGLLRAVDSALQKREVKVGWENGELRFRCTGVDALNWDRSMFKERVKDLRISKPAGSVRCQFVTEDMETYLRDSSSPTGLIQKKFTFICLSFADVGQYLQLVGAALPQLLTKFGRVLVLDNDTPAVRSLSSFGYKRSFVGDGVCMHSRDRLEFGTPYHPPANSPMLQDKLRKMIEQWAQLSNGDRLIFEMNRLRIDQEGVFMPPMLLQEWKKATASDRLGRQACVAHQKLRTRQMSTKADALKQMALDYVKEVLGNSAEQSDIRILSLGCGPGSDLLGLLRAADFIISENSVAVRGDLQFHCTGVDAFDWSWSDLGAEIQKLRISSRVKCKFVCEDMESFVHDNLKIGGIILEKYDIICLSFADASRCYRELIGAALPQLLSDIGRILVLQRNIPTENSLTRFGYECTYCSLTNECLLSRGPSVEPLNGTYRPAQRSPYRLYQMRKEISELMDSMRLGIKRLRG